MKNIFKPGLAIALVMIFAACKKAGVLPLYQDGINPTLSASGTILTPPASDSSKVGLTLAWTDPLYATSATNVKYTVEIDTAGNKFANAFSKVVTGALNTTFTNKELNTIMIARGWPINSTVSLDVRVIASYANNDQRLYTDPIRIKYTVYKIPPKVVLPSSSRLFLVGDATAGGWNNPVPVPTQEFSRLDETTWAGIFNLVGGKQYLMLPVNGDWGHKYSVANNTVAGLSAGGDFGYDLNDNFPGPTANGWYRIVADFQTGKFSVTPYNGTLPTNLYIVGDATPGGWNNPVPVPSQQLTRLTSSTWEITLNFVGGKEYLLLPLNGDWGHKYAVPNKTVANLWQGGEFGYDLGDNFPGPPTSGSKKLTVNFAAPVTAANRSGTFTVQ